MWRVERGRVAFTQAFKASACSAFIRPELPPTSNAVRPSIPLCPNTPCQPRIVSSSHRKNSATSCQLLPASRSTRALERCVTRQTIEPSRASAIRAFRSSSLRKPPRITRRSESRQPQHASDFSRILSESGYIKAQKEKFVAAGRPILSIDAKKKEPIGNYKNGGRELCGKSSPEHVNVYDFVDPEVGRATPYGVYDITQNKGWVSVGISFDTARFAVNTLRQWWLNCGEREYAGTQGLLVNADGGGSNGSRVRLWKISLQEFANEINIPITVCHYPPGTSKWNPIEHRMFAPISANWRAKPLRSFNDATQYIRATTTKTGLAIAAALDTTIYEKGVKITKKQIKALNMTRHAFHGEWNYTISPTCSP